MKAVVAAFNQEKALVGAFSVITNLRMDFFEALMRIGSYHAAMINDWRLARQLFSKEEFSGRIVNYTTSWAKSFTEDNKGIVFANGSFYHSQKLFCVKHLKNLGFGKTSMETVIKEQANLLIEHLLSHKGPVVVNNELFSTPIVNVLWSMMAGRFS